MSIDIFLKLILEEIFYIIEHFQNICVIICYNFTVKYFAFKMNGGSKMKKILSTLLIVATLAGSVSGMVFGTCCAESPEEIRLARAIVSEIVQKNKTDKEKKEIDKSKIRKKVNRFITKNKGYLPDDKIPQIRKVLMALSLEELENISSIDLTSPELIQVISIFFGFTGIDRLLIGSYGMFLLKFFTAGNFGILWLYDVCTIKGKVREKNFDKLMSSISEIC